MIPIEKQPPAIVVEDPGFGEVLGKLDFESYVEAWGRMFPDTRIQVLAGSGFPGSREGLTGLSSAYDPESFGEEKQIERPEGDQAPTGRGPVFNF